MEVGDKKEMQKDGVDYLIKQGYKNLSSKTFISDRDLEQFLNKDFTNINKTRALGFIQILEREYDVDLSELKVAYLEHVNLHKPRKPETLFTEIPNDTEPTWKRYLPLLAGALAVFGLAFYLFRPSVESIQTPEPVIEQIEENKSVIDEAQKNIEKLELNKSRASVLEKSLEKEQNVSSASVNDDLDLDKVVLQMMQDRNLSSRESNVSIDINSTKKSTKKEDNQFKIAKPEAKKVKKSDKLANMPLAKTIPVKKSKPATKNTKATSVGGLFISPTQKAWVGIIYLDNFTKKDFLIRNKLPLDANRDQLIVIGHGNFKIYNKTYSVKFRGKGPVRFIYKDGELMEISKKEFKRSSAGVAW